MPHPLGTGPGRSPPSSSRPCSDADRAPRRSPAIHSTTERVIWPSSRRTRSPTASARAASSSARATASSKSPAPASTRARCPTASMASVTSSPTEASARASSATGRARAGSSSWTRAFDKVKSARVRCRPGPRRRMAATTSLTSSSGTGWPSSQRIHTSRRSNHARRGRSSGPWSSPRPRSIRSRAIPGAPSVLRELRGVTQHVRQVGPRQALGVGDSLPGCRDLEQQAEPLAVGEGARGLVCRSHQRHE